MLFPPFGVIIFGMSMYYSHPQGTNVVVRFKNDILRSNSLDDLHPAFRPYALELKARANALGIYTKTIETKRAIRQHKTNVENGTSWLSHKLSRHCFGFAIDEAPIHCLSLPDWGPDEIEWQQLGLIGEQIGLVWGGRWKSKDMAHFEASKALLKSIDFSKIILWE